MNWLRNIIERLSEKKVIQDKSKRLKEKSFFAVEWSKSPEAKLSESFEDYNKGLKFAAELLNKTYGIPHSGSRKVMSQTAEVLAMANILKRIGVSRDTIQGIYPHPKKKGAVLIEKKDGCVFEISSKDKVSCKRISANDPLLDFWHANDKVLFPNDEAFYL